MRHLFCTLILLSGITAFAQPDASFTIDRNKVCSGTKVSFTNTSTGADSYSWYVNNVFYSNNLHDSAILTEPCYDLQPIMLVAFSTTGADTMTKVVEVFDTCAMHLYGDYTNCVGDTIRKNVHPAAISQLWTITPPHTLIAGCDTCDSIAFVLAVLGTTVDLYSTYEGGCSQPVTFHYPFCNPLTGTGISTLTDEQIKIFPNPATEYISIDAPANEQIRRVQLYNSLGALVSKQEGAARKMNISQLPPGMYFIKVDLTGQVIIQKVQKQ